MRTLGFDVIGRCREYFDATVNGYRCKILIDDNSVDLALGVRTLVVVDRSIYNAYGCDLLYSLVSKYEKDSIFSVDTSV